MALHRLAGIEIGVPEPDVLDGFYQEIGFTGSPGAWGGEDTPEQLASLSPNLTIRKLSELSEFL